jgi:subtilase family serine protease
MVMHAVGAGRSGQALGRIRLVGYAVAWQAALALLSCGGAAAAPPYPPPLTSAQCQQVYRVTCYSPRQLRRAYDLPALYAHGFNGRGRTIVIVDPFGSPTIRSDLAAFDRAYGLPAPAKLRILAPVGPIPPFDPANPAMVQKAGETTEDVEWAHVIAPAAGILLVETPVAENSNGAGFPQYMAAENYVVKHHLGAVISQSFSLPEQNFASFSSVRRLRYAYRNAYRNRVTVLAASNDLGVSGVNAANSGLYDHRVVYWPASDPLVTGVGATKLYLDAAGREISPDTAWNDTQDPAAAALFGVPSPFPIASGGGESKIYPRPVYQSNIRRTTGGHRGVPDVSLSGSLSGAIEVFASFSRPAGIWFPTGGTSAATPELAGIVAIADQYAKRRLGLINPALYELERRRASGIVDVTHGNNSVAFNLGTGLQRVVGYRAKHGYDLVTGVGTIDAARFVPQVARRNARSRG